jgi:hypothetical protein
MIYRQVIAHCSELFARNQFVQQFKLSTTLLSVLMLISCAQHSINKVSQCNTVCQHHYENCQKTCRNNEIQCHAYSATTTSTSYYRYIQEQRIKGGLITRQLNSYHDPLQCAKTTCNCSFDYQICGQSCNGFIHKQLLEPPLSR